MPKKISLKASVHAVTSTSNPRLLITADYARFWFQDASKEAVSEGVDSVRREIIFAVCFAETYIFEWARDHILEGDPNELKEYFDKFGVREKWEVLKRLHSEMKIKGCINFNRGENFTWDDFHHLIDLRNGIVHSAVSIPESSDPETNWRDELKTPTDLNNYPNGKATKVVTDLIKQLHQAIGTEPPDWLTSVK